MNRPPHKKAEAAAAAPRRERMENFLSRRRNWVLLAIILLAGLVRQIYFLQAVSGPLVVMHKWDQTDMAYYDFWARRILDGDILSRDVPPPLHEWHMLLADKWLEMNPALKASMQQQASSAGAATEAAQKEHMQRALWRQWIGARRFYQEPAYPYLVALTYKVFSPDPRWVFLWQMVLGIVGAVLVHRVTERHFGALPAAVAGAFAALATPTLMHELTLLRDTLITFMGILLVYLTDEAVGRRRVIWWLLLGFAVGFAMLTKGVYYLFCLGLMGLLVLVWWRRWKGLAISAGAMLVGVALALSPVIWRNIVVGVPPTAIAGNNAVVSFVANNLGSFSWDSPNPIDESEFPRIVGESDGSLWKGAVASLRTQPSVWSVVWMVACKFDQVWHWWERPDNTNIYYYQLHAPILKIPFTYWMAAFPGLLGLALSLRHPRRHLSLYLLLLTAVAPLVLVNVLARYRLPVLMALIPLGAFAVVQTIQWLWRRQWQGFAAIGAMIALALWTGRPMSVQHGPLIRVGDIGGTFQAYYLAPFRQAVNDKDYRRAADTLADFLRHVPGYIDRLDGAHEPREQQEAYQAYMMVCFYRDCQRFYEEAGDREKAWKYAKRADDLTLSVARWRNKQPLSERSPQ